MDVRYTYLDGVRLPVLFFPAPKQDDDVLSIDLTGRDGSAILDR